MATANGIKKKATWTKKYDESTKPLYFSTYISYGDIQDGKGLNPSQVETYLMYQRPGLLRINEWVTGAKLGVDGKWTPLKESEALVLYAGETLQPSGSSSEKYVLGEPVRKDLAAGGTDTLRYQAINNAKALLQSSSGASSNDVNQAYNISNNITPPGQAPTPSIIGDPLRADEETPTPAATTEAPTGPTSTDLTNLSKGIAGRPPRTDYGDLKYPKDIKLDKSDAIQFTMFTYGTKAFKSDSFGFGDRDLVQTKGSVTMSIQPTISDLNVVRWSPSEMGPIATAGADSSLTFIEEGAQGLETIKDKIARSLGKEGESITKAIIASAAGEASGAKGLLTRVTGAMFNNNLELLFQGPELRQFTFTFKLSPRYKTEADQVKEIIRFFKQGSAVQRSTTNLFLKSPNVFKIRYLKGEDKDHKSLNRIKECALVSCGVDYTPTGSYMTFSDEEGTMVSYTLSLTFNELEPVYEDEYNALSKTEIGY